MSGLARQMRDPVYANAYALVLNSALSAALGFAYWLVAARLFDAEDLGWGAAVVSAATLAALLGKAGFDAALIRFGPSADDARLRRLVLQAVIGAVGLTLLVAIAILVLAQDGLASLAPLRSASAAVGFVLLATGTATAWVLDALFIAEQRAVITLTRNVTMSLVKIAAPFAVVAAFASFAVPLSWGAGLAASLVVALAALPWSLRHRAAPAEAAAPRARLVWGYAAKNYALSISEFLPGLLLPLLVLETLGPATNARFFLAWTIASVGFLASKGIAQSTFAALVRDGPAASSLGKGLRTSALLLGPFGLALLGGAPLLPHAFGAASGPDAVAMLRVLALSFAPLCVTNLYLSLLKARRAGWELTLFPVATLVAFLALVPLALARGGIVGVGWLWLAVQMAAGLYAGARLLPLFLRSSHGIPQPARLGRRAHEG